MVCEALSMPNPRGCRKGLVPGRGGVELNRRGRGVVGLAVPERRYTLMSADIAELPRSALP